MANLFRCPSKMEEREYLIKAVGQLQSGYITHKLEIKTYNDSTNASGVNWAEASNVAQTASIVEFNATEWNKIHIKKAYTSNRSTSINYVGVSSRRDMNLLEYGTYKSVTATATDYVIDISSRSGTVYFFIYTRNTSTSGSSKTVVDGDVYLTK